MKKRKISAIICCILMMLLCGCSGKTDAEGEEKGTETAEVLDVAQVRSICELATLKCYYHNVAEVNKEKGSGLLHWGEKERQLWIEYTGVVTVGIDMSKLQISKDGNTIHISIPEGKVLDYKVASIEENNYISSDDSWFNKNPITAEEQTQAIDAAQEKMKNDVESNEKILRLAQDRAKKLIGNYVDSIEKLSNTEYEISWD